MNHSFRLAILSTAFLVSCFQNVELVAMKAQVAQWLKEGLAPTERTQLTASSSTSITNTEAWKAVEAQRKRKKHVRYCKIISVIMVGAGFAGLGIWRWVTYFSPSHVSSNITNITLL